jgi:zinc D-Ala-D-Ala carboxypeptidase
MRVRFTFAVYLACLLSLRLVAACNHQLDSIPSFTKEELLGKFNPSKHASFTLIEPAHTSKTGIYLRKEAYEAFKQMHRTAAAAHITLTILSATRNFDAQKAIWERKWKRPQYEGKQDLDRIKDILKYSSMPGTSRHHWGTEIDLNSLEPAYFKSGNGLVVYQWLQAHAAEFGFYQTYTSKLNGRPGYEEEAWHWSYIPLSGPMLKAYNASINYSDLVGFSGSESASKARVIEDFVNGIDANLLK